MEEEVQRVSEGLMATINRVFRTNESENYLISALSKAFGVKNFSQLVRGMFVIMGEMEGLDVRGIDVPGWVTLHYDLEQLRKAVESNSSKGRTAGHNLSDLVSRTEKSERSEPEKSAKSDKPRK